MDPRALVVAVTLALGAGCGPEPDFVTARGIAFHLNGSRFIDRAVAETQEERFLRAIDREVAWDKADVRACVEGTAVDVVPTGLFPCTFDPDVPCAGEQHGSVLKIAATECPWSSAFIHELLHRLQDCLERRVDYNHVASEWRLVYDQNGQDAANCAQPAAVMP